jgi:hypothetical protein
MVVQKKTSFLLLLGSIGLALSRIQICSSFVQPTRTVRDCALTKNKLLQVQVSILQSSQSDQVDRLLQLVDESGDDDNENDATIRQCVLDLSDEPSLLEDDPFEPLLGNYNVSRTLPAQASERPVGGKWNSGKLFAIQQSWQHLLKPSNDKPQSVAQAINIIVLTALSRWNIHVILRGDAYALTEPERTEIAELRKTPGGLSPRTVRADFDPPRIVFSSARRPLFGLTLGPTSSVFLDTTYCDDRVRIGKGSKGSLFVFARSTAPQADDWKDLMQVKPVGKRQLLAIFGILAGASGTASWKLSGLGRWLTLPLAVASLASTLLIWKSTGGIERDRQSAIDATKVSV